jgi:hypothetical protein
LDDTHINERVYSEWINNETESLNTVFITIFDSLQYIYENTDTDKFIIEPLYKQFLQVKETIKEGTIELAKSSNYDESFALVVNFKEAIINFLDLFPSEAFNL